VGYPLWPVCNSREFAAQDFFVTLLRSCALSSGAEC
jgi:hypothetical protein